MCLKNGTPQKVNQEYESDQKTPNSWSHINAVNAWLQQTWRQEEQLQGRGWWRCRGGRGRRRERCSRCRWGGRVGLAPRFHSAQSGGILVNQRQDKMLLRIFAHNLLIHINGLTVKPFFSFPTMSSEEMNVPVPNLCLSRWNWCCKFSRKSHIMAVIGEVGLQREGNISTFEPTWQWERPWRASWRERRRRRRQTPQRAPGQHSNPYFLAVSVKSENDRTKTKN